MMNTENEMKMYYYAYTSVGLYELLVLRKNWIVPFIKTLEQTIHYRED